MDAQIGDVLELQLLGLTRLPLPSRPIVSIHYYSQGVEVNFSVSVNYFTIRRQLPHRECSPGPRRREHVAKNYGIARALYAYYCIIS